MFNKTLNGSRTFDPARKNMRKVDSFFVEKESRKFPHLNNANNRENDQGHNEGGKWHHPDIDYSFTARLKNKKKNFKRYHDMNGVQSETIHGNEISELTNWKKKKRHGIAEGVPQVTSESSVCEDLTSQKKKYKKMKVKSFQVNGENFQEEALQYEEQNECAVSEKIKKKKRKEEIPYVIEMIPEQSQEGDGLTPKRRKKKAKNNISHGDQEHHAEEPRHNWFTSTRETKKTTVTVENECKGNDEFLESTVTQANEKEQEGDQKDYVHRGDLSEPLVVKKKKKKKQSFMIDQFALRSPQPEVRHFNQEQNQHTVAKHKKDKRRKLLSLSDVDDVQREVQDPILAGGTCEKSESHGSPSKRFANSPPLDSYITKRKKRRINSNEGDVDPSKNASVQPSIVKTEKSKKKKMVDNFNCISDCMEYGPRHTEDTDHQAAVAGPSGITWKKTDTDIDDDRNGKETHNGDVMEKEHRVPVVIEEQSLGFHDKSVEKTEQRIESLVDQKDSSLGSQASGDTQDDKIEKSPPKQEKSPKVIRNSVKDENKIESSPSRQKKSPKVIRGNVKDENKIEKSPSKQEKSPKVIRNSVKDENKIESSPSRQKKSPKVIRDNVKDENKIESSPSKQKKSPKVVGDNVKDENKIESSPSKQKKSPKVIRDNVKDKNKIESSSSKQKKTPKVIRDNVKDKNKIESSPSKQKKTPKEQQTGDERLNLSSTSKFTVSLITPKAEPSSFSTKAEPFSFGTKSEPSSFSTSTPSTDTPRLGSTGSQRKLTQTLLSDMYPRRENECGVKPSLDQILEPFITLHCDPDPITLSDDNEAFVSEESLESYPHYEDVPKFDQLLPGVAEAHVTSTPKIKLCEEGDASCTQMESSFNCELCCKTFTEARNLRRHSLVHLPKSERSFTCGVCDKQYLCKKSFFRHKETHTSKKYKCEECGEAFFQFSHLKSHAAGVHGESAVACDLCELFFPSYRAFNGHLTTHVDKQHVCLICGKLLNDRLKYEQHMRSHGAKPPVNYHCDICAKTYKSRQNLHDHLRSHGNKTWQCTQCTKTFYLARQLEYHMVVHADERPFACGICEKTFKRESDRTTHRLCHSYKVKEPEKRILTPAAAKMLFKKEQTLKKGGLFFEVTVNTLPSSQSGGSDHKAVEEKNVSPDGREANVAREKEAGDHFRCSNCRRVYSGDDKKLCQRCLLKKSKLSLSERREV